MNRKVENEMALPITKSVTVMLLEPYAGKLARTVLRGESSRKGADLLDPKAKFLIERMRLGYTFNGCMFDFSTLFINIPIFLIGTIVDQ